MSASEDFLSLTEEKEVVAAIGQAERNTSGEIRVHIEEHTEKPPLERAQEVFFQLEMEHTKQRNGVLFYIAALDHSFVILGDVGIDQVVPKDFWDKTKDLVLRHFKEGENKAGLITGILEAGEQLKLYFPYDAATDVDELSNEISRG